MREKPNEKRTNPPNYPMLIRALPGEQQFAIISSTDVREEGNRPERKGYHITSTQSYLSFL